MGNLELMREALITERVQFLIELLHPYMPLPNVIYDFAEILVDEGAPPLKPPRGRGLSPQYTSSWFTVHEAWFVHNLTEEAQCLRSRK